MIRRMRAPRTTLPRRRQTKRVEGLGVKGLGTLSDLILFMGSPCTATRHSAFFLRVFVAGRDRVDPIE